MATMNDQILTTNQFRVGSKLDKRLEKRVNDFDAVDIMLVQIGDMVVGTSQVGFDLYLGRDVEDI